MATTLRGIHSAMATPFTPDGERIDESLLRAQVDRTIEGGADGVVPCGSTGEFTTLSEAERRRVVEVVCDQAASRVPVIAQTGATTTRQAAALSRHAEQAGADAVMLIAPYYEPLSLEEIRSYYAGVAEAVEIPIVVYNLPPVIGVNLEPDWVAGLAQEIPNVSHVKDTTGDLTQLGRLVHEHGDDIGAFVGWDTLVLPALQIGAAGAIVGASNILAPQLADMAAAVADGRHGDALDRWLELYPVMDFLVSAGYYAASIKSALELIGHPAGPCRAPVAPLATDKRARLATLLEPLGLLPTAASA